MTTIQAHRGLTFSPTDHVYRFDGEVIPSVTQVLSRANMPDYSAIPPFQLEWAAKRGTLAHLLCEWDDDPEMVIDWESVDERLYPYLNAYRQFREHTGFVIEANEQRLWNPRHRYAGTVDRVGMLTGRRVVLELKTTSVLHPATAIQTSAYLHAYNESRPKAEQARGCVAVHLRGDGTYRLQKYDNPRDHFACFLALLHPEHPWSEQTIAMWRAANEKDVAA
jgi:hypothetical protein